VENHYREGGTVFTCTRYSTSHRRNHQKIAHERGESLLQNGMLHFVFWIGQLSENRTSKLEFTETKNRLF